jgi:hypothetical protein
MFLDPDSFEIPYTLHVSEPSDQVLLLPTHEVGVVTNFPMKKSHTLLNV